MTEIADVRRTRRKRKNSIDQVQEDPLATMGKKSGEAGKTSNQWIMLSPSE